MKVAAAAGIPVTYGYGKRLFEKGMSRSDSSLGF